MIFLADESVDFPIVEFLREKKHVVFSIGEMQPGLSDNAVLTLANRKKALLLTADKDFGELIFRQGRISQGIVLIRLFGLTPETKSQIVASAIHEHAAKIKNAFSVITPNITRIRQKN